MAKGDMLFIDHLKELRNRFLRIIILTLVIMVFCTVFGFQQVTLNHYTFYFITPTVYNNISSQVTLFLSETLIPVGVDLIQTAPGQSLYAQIYVAMLLAMSGSIPLIVREIFAFISPAISLKNRKSVFFKILIPIALLYFSGIVFSFYLAIPLTLTFLYQYGQSIGVLTFLNISDFINFVLHFFIAFGITFQLPLVMYILTDSGLISLKFWLKNLKFALLIIVIFGAIITPDGSGITMWFISMPMLLLYFIGIVIIKLGALKD